MQTISKIVIKNNKRELIAYSKNNIILTAKVHTGKRGVTESKIEGDGKTPLGKYKLGICFGTHKKTEVQNNQYIEINSSMYWIDDVKSKYYNQMIDTEVTKKDWNSGEHLIKYKKQYEYAIEIKINPENIPYKGSAIFLHCSVGKPTQGCIAVDTNTMKEIINRINENTVIEIYT